MSARVDLPENLRTLRNSRGMSQQSLAGRAGVSRNTVANIELGRKESPTLADVLALADALSVHPMALITGPDWVADGWSEAWFEAWWSGHRAALVQAAEALARISEGEA